MNSQEYQEADAKHRAAYRVYAATLAKYRAMEIDDAEFLTAKRVYEKQTAEFDLAYERERNR